MRTCAGPSGPGWWYTYPSEKYESQLGLLFPLYGKIKFMFQTTNQVGSITVSPTHSIPIVSPPTCPFCARSMKNAKKTCPYVLHFFSSFWEDFAKFDDIALVSRAKRPLPSAASAAQQSSSSLPATPGARWNRWTRPGSSLRRWNHRQFSTPG